MIVDGAVIDFASRLKLQAHPEEHSHVHHQRKKKRFWKVRSEVFAFSSRGSWSANCLLWSFKRSSQKMFIVFMPGGEADVVSNARISYSSDSKNIWVMEALKNLLLF